MMVIAPCLRAGDDRAHLRVCKATDALQLIGQHILFEQQLGGVVDVLPVTAATFAGAEVRAAWENTICRGVEQCHPFSEGDAAFALWAMAFGTRALMNTHSATAQLAIVDGLESAQSATDLFLYPGRPLRVVDALITNFHLPRSTLLMLVAAFAGRDRVLAAYREAIRRGYRFYSFGDAMLIA